MSNSEGANFDRAESLWQLDRLFLDLALVKGKNLTLLEKKILQGLLCGCSPSEISEKLYQNRNSTSVRVYLSNSIYRYLQELLIRQERLETKIGHWSNITRYLEEAGYRKVPATTEIDRSLENESDSRIGANDGTCYRDLDEQIPIDNFIGRETELETLNNWILRDNCRAIAIFGLIGMGKSSLSAKLVTSIAGNFQYLFWRSLREPRSLESLLIDLIDRFTTNTKLPETIEGKISLLLDLFRSYRCLLVLDCFDRLFVEGEIAGTYRSQYRDYQRFVQRLCGEERGSCCLILSREQPQEFAIFQGEKVRSFHLSGLSTTEATQILQQQGSIGSESEREHFVNIYANIPLVIERANLTVVKIFNGNLTDFLVNNTYLLSNILEILDEQFRYLTATERKLLYSFVVNQKLFKAGKIIGREFSCNLPKHLQIEAIESLQRRSILLPNSHRLAYEPLLRVYILEKLISEIEEVVQDPDLGAIVRYVFNDRD